LLSNLCFIYVYFSLRQIGEEATNWKIFQNSYQVLKNYFSFNGMSANNKILVSNVM